MQRDENLVYINNGQRYGMSIVSGWMFSYVTVRPKVVYIRRSGSVQIQPDRPPISVRA